MQVIVQVSVPDLIIMASSFLTIVGATALSITFVLATPK